MYGSGVPTLIVPFIALCILAVLVDKATLVLEEIMHRIPWLPDRFWGPIAYLIVFAISFAICWRGNFNFFTSLNFVFQHSYEGWLLTALLVSGGSAFVKSSFGMISSIPQVISMVYSTATGFLGGSTSSTTSSTTATGTTSNPNMPP